MKKYAKVGEIFITVLKEESFTYSNDITEFPIEDGSYISENVNTKPVLLSLSGLIIGEKSYPAKELFTLRRYAYNKVVVKYVGINKFSLMMIENFTNTHNSSVANGIEFNMTLKEIKIVKSKLVSINVKNLKIPNLEKLKEAKADVKREKAAAKKAKIKKKTKAGKKAKTKKEKPSALQKILNKYK